VNVRLESTTMTPKQYMNDDSTKKHFEKQQGIMNEQSRSGLFLTYIEFLCPYLITPHLRHQKRSIAVKASGSASSQHGGLRASTVYLRMAPGVLE
jgi:hypothetical protein